MTSETFFSALNAAFGSDGFSRDSQILENFGRDWTKVFPPKPCGVVFPKSTAEVVEITRLCREADVALVPSGGRTGLAGGAVAARGELVLSLSKMNAIGPVDTLAHTVRVQAGAVTEAVHQACEAHGLTWPVDFASKGSSHVGGNIATNAGGIRVIRYGMTRNWVLGLQVVTMQGEVLELNGALEKNNTGLDLRQLFIGTEGTLGIITEATLKLTRVPRECDVFFFSVADIPAVLKLFHESRKGPFELMAFECLTQNCLDAVLKMKAIASPLSTPGGAYVVLEVERPEAEDAKNRLEAWLSGLFEQGLVRDGTLAQSPREAKEIWSLREGVAEAITHIAQPHKNDIAVPVARLEPFIDEMMTMFSTKHAEFPVYFFGHIGDGNLHVNTLKPQNMDKETFLKRVHKTDEDLFPIVKRYGGSISAEHGIGLLKKEALPFSRSPTELAYLRSIKSILDPKGLLNPGKIF